MSKTKGEKRTMEENGVNVYTVTYKESVILSDDGYDALETFFTENEVEFDTDNDSIYAIKKAQVNLRPETLTNIREVDEDFQLLWKRIEGSCDDELDGFPQLKSEEQINSCTADYFMEDDTLDDFAKKNSLSEELLNKMTDIIGENEDQYEFQFITVNHESTRQKLT
jgi:hypothetical protein